MIMRAPCPSPLGLRSASRKGSSIHGKKERDVAQLSFPLQKRLVDLADVAEADAIEGGVKRLQAPPFPRRPSQGDAEEGMPLRRSSPPPSRGGKSAGLPKSWSAAA